MFNANNAPSTAYELNTFMGAVATEVDHKELNPREVSLVIAVDDGDSLLMLASTDGHDASTIAQLDQPLADHRRMAALVTTTGWSPADDVPTSVTWLTVAVGVGGVAACAAVRRVHEDQQWSRVAPQELPWVALSTASALRAALESGRPLRLKAAGSTALFRRPDQVPLPPLDDRGQL